MMGKKLALILQTCILLEVVIVSAGYSEAAVRLYLIFGVSDYCYLMD